MFQTKTIDHWAMKELGLVRRKLEMEASVAALEDEAGAVMLDAEENGSREVSASFDRLQRAQAEIRAIGAAITACRARRLDAIGASRAAEIARLRKAAAEKSAELRSIESKTKKLLDQLAVLEGCDHVPAAATKSGTLRAEIGPLERSANDLEAGGVPTSGYVDLETVTATEDFLIAVANYPAHGPSIEHAADWLSECEESARKYCNAGFGDSPCRIRLVWDGDGIKSDSYVFCAALAKKNKSADGSEYFDIPSGTFRAGIATTAGYVARSHESTSSDGWYRA